MSNAHIFISHSSKDDDFVQELREAFESYGFIVWVDSRSLRGGAKLAPEIDEAIEQARQVICSGIRQRSGALSIRRTR